MSGGRLLCGLALVACGSDPGSGEAAGSNGTGPTTTGQTSSATPTGGTGSGTASGPGTDDGTTDTDDDTGMTTGGDNPPPSGMPAGIPFPTFGYLYDTDVPPTIFVDNTNPACDDGQGTADAPLCDLFAGGDAGSWVAGDVVSILGGPYIIDGDKTLTFAGTEDTPVIIRAPEQVRFDAQGNVANFQFDGEFAIVENIDFFDATRHRVLPSGNHLVFRGIEVHNPEGAFIDFNPVFNIEGHDVLLHGSAIYDNRRMNDSDTHGVQTWQGSYNVWILDSEFYNNNGDAFQACHECFATPPHHIYIGRNVMHEDRENGVDLKTIHDVVVSENVMYGYGSSQTSSGDAMVIGSNGYDEGTGQGPRNVWVLNNEFRDSGAGVRIEGAQDVWILGNVFTSLGTGLQVDDKEYRDVVIAANVFDGVDTGIYSYNDSCTVDSLTIENNIIGNAMSFHVDWPSCANVTMANNLLWGGMSVRIGGQMWGDAASLDAEAFAMGHLDVDPQFEGDTFQPSAESPAVDAGVTLEPYHAAVEAAYGGEARKDLTGAPRPAGGGPDIGAYER